MVFYKILKWLLGGEEDYHERYCKKSPSHNIFVRSSPSRHYLPVSRSDPETLTSVRDVNLANSSRIGSTRIGSLSNSSERSTIPYVPPRVPTTPHIQPRLPIVPVIPPRVVIDPRLRVDAEFVSLSSFASYSPPSSSSSTSSANPPSTSSSSKQSTSSHKPTTSVSKPSPSSSGLSLSSLKSALPLYKPTPIVPVIPPRVVIDPRLRVDAESVSLSSFASYPPLSSSSSTSFAKIPPASSSSKQSTSSLKPTPSVSKPLPSSSGPSSTSLKSTLPLYKPTLAPAPAPSISTNQQGKTDYNWVEKATSPIYAIPKDIEDWIKKDIVPRVLRKPLSPSPAPSLSKQSTSSPKATPSVSKPSPSSSGPSSSSLKSALPLYKPTLAPAPAPAPSISKNQQGKTNYIWVEKATSPIYAIPKDIECLIKEDIVPRALRKPLSPSTYKGYFGALLHAEDFYIEKWSDYLMKNISLELQKASIFRRSDRNTFPSEGDEKTFVTFEMDSVPERRPFLLSRDFVYLQPLDEKVEPLEGVICRVVKSNLVLVEFEEDFHSQHYPARKYNVSFSFNRFCLKRAHQAVEAASDPSFQSFLFPDFVHRNLSSSSSHSFNHKLDLKQTSAILRIINLSRPPPYLVEGPLSVDVKRGVLSKTGSVVQEAIVHIIRTSPKSRILVCAPSNNTCDVLMRSLRKEISESDMFRANAAFRELDGVPVDVLPSCRYKDECFTCPSLKELKKFKVVLSTFVSSSRLHGEGITAGHFTHIFLVDASSTTEPEAMVGLANLANDNTAVVVTGAPNNRTSWVRSDIARQNGLRISYFERLRESRPYKSLDPMFISQLENTRRESDDTY